MTDHGEEGEKVDMQRGNIKQKEDKMHKIFNY